MSGTTYQTHRKRAIQPKFRGRKRVRSRYAPRYPSTAEREYRRICRAYSAAVTKPMRKQLDTVMKAYRRQAAGGTREDGIFDFIALVHEAIINIAAEISLALEELDLMQSVGKIGGMVQHRSATEWIAAVRASLGIELMMDDYEGDVYNEAVKQWASRNLEYLNGAPAEFLLSIEAVIGSAYRERMDPDELETVLQKRLDSVRNRAEWNARDQVSSLNAGLMKMYQKGSGVNRYMWKSERDGSVRDCHAAFDGHIYSWDDPPEDWHYTKSMGRVYTGDAYNPGEAYGCRCCAVPVFERDTFKTAHQ